MKISTRLVLLCFFIVSLAVGATYSVMSYHLNRSLTSYLLDGLNAAVHRIEARLIMLVRHNFDRLRIIASRAGIQEDVEAVSGSRPDPEAVEHLRRRLQEIVQMVQGFNEIYILDPQGKLLVSSRADDKFTNPFLRSLGRLSENGNAALLPDLQGNAALYMASPIYASHESRRIAGYLCVIASIESFAALTPAERHLGASAEISVAYEGPRSADYFITKLRKGGLEGGIDIRRYRKTGREESLIIDHLDRKSSSLFEGKDAEEISVIAISHYIQPLGWELVIKVPRNEAFSLVNEIREQGVFLIFILSFIAVTVALMLARSITKPLTHLSGQCRDLMAGRLDFDFNPESSSGGDEIALFQKTFQHMIIQIKDQMEKLRAQQDSLIAMMHDTEEAKNKAESAELQFRRVIEATPAAVMMLNNNHRITLVNAAAEKLFGYRREELLGKQFEELLPRHSAVKAASESLFSNALSSAGGQRLYEITGIRKDQQEIPLEIALNPIETLRGAAVMAALTDLSERRRAEEYRSFLAAIVSSSEDAVIGKTMDGVVTSWNEGAEKMFGYSADELCGRALASLFTDDGDRFFAALNRVGQSGGIERFDAVWKTKEGSPIDVSLTMSPVRDTLNRTIGISTIARDITERKKYELRLSERNKELEKANLELDSFVYIASHDLRAPLRAISSFASFLEEDYAEKLDSQGKDYLLEIRKGADRLSRLIEDLLTLSRISRIKNPFEDVDMNAIVQAAIERLEYDIKALNVELIIENVFSKVRCDRIKITEVFVNLLNNAIKFSSKENSGRPRIEIGASEHPEEYVFYVRDNGIGLEAKYKDQIFQLFKRLHPANKYEGTGAGLSIVKRIIEDHKGRIWVESALGQGAAFYFTIPKNLGADIKAPQRNEKTASQR